MNYHENLARVRHHETALKIVPAGEAASKKSVTAEFWRSGGGCVPGETGRATLVRRITDLEYQGFGMVARYGNAID